MRHGTKQGPCPPTTHSEIVCIRDLLKVADSWLAWGLRGGSAAGATWSADQEYIPIFIDACFEVVGRYTSMGPGSMSRSLSDVHRSVVASYGTDHS